MRDDCGILGETRLSRNFQRLMRRAAANGRDEALFGQKYIAAANEVVKKSSLRHMPRTSFCLEFPLTGKPYMDIFVNLQCGKMEAPVKFEVGDGFGLASFVNACAADETLKDYQLYFTFDLSADRHIPNVYLLPPNRKGNISYVLAMMDKLNALERKEQTATVLGKVPSGWQIYYAGFMHTRTDAPLRLGFVANPECVRGYARDSSLLARDFNVFYPGGLTEVLQEQLSLLADAIEAGAEMEIQLDLLSKIPVSFRGKVMKVAAIVRAYEKETNEAVDAAYDAAPKGSRKEFMVWVNSNVEHKLRGYVRMKYLGKPYNVLKKSTGYLKLKDMGVTDYKEVLSE